MKRLLLSAVLALAATGCSQSSVVRPAVSERFSQENDKCTLVQTLMHERVPQQLLAGVSHAEDSSAAQVVVYLHRPEDAVLERLFVGEPRCEGPGYSVVQESTREAVVLFLQPRGTGFVYSAQRAAPGQLALGGESKGSVNQRDDGAWVASDVL